VLLEPASASSGIPGLIAFLNGVVPSGGKSHIGGHETSFISWQTGLSKLVGMICSIPSGLCVGPEGPIIHISALLGHWSTRLCQYLEHHLCPRYYFTAQTSEARDFLATGAACGTRACVCAMRLRHASAPCVCGLRRSEPRHSGSTN
jgi:H+/Cl- antiporter ClcA